MTPEEKASGLALAKQAFAEGDFKTASRIRQAFEEAFPELVITQLGDGSIAKKVGENKSGDSVWEPLA